MSITNPVLSDKAKAMFAEGLGKENLEAFLAADVNDHAVDVLEINGGNEAVASALQIGANLTVGQLAERFETAVGGITEEDKLAAEASAQAAAQSQSGLTPAQQAANKKAADQAAASAAAGSAGSEVSTTAESPAPVAPAVVEETAAEAPADLQAQPADVGADSEAVSGLVEPQWVESLGATAKLFKGAFDKYVSDMRPKRPVDPTTAARNQVVLVRTLCGMINSLEGQEFHDVFNYVLQQFVVHREGALRELAIFRSIEVNQLSSEQAKLLPRLINMLILTADPATRQYGLQQVSLDKTLAGELINENGRRRVFQYFGK